MQCGKPCSLRQDQHSEWESGSYQECLNATHLLLRPTNRNDNAKGQFSRYNGTSIAQKMSRLIITFALSKGLRKKIMICALCSEQNERVPLE